MSMQQPTDRQRRWATLKLPLVAVGIGLAYLIAGFLGDDLGFGIFGLLLMTSLAVVLWLVSHRSETVRGLMDRRDERINAIDLKSTAFAGSTVLAIIIIAFVVEIAQGRDGAPYSWLGAVGGVAYVLAVIVERLRG